MSQSVDDIQRFISHEGHKFAEFEVADCSIAIVSRALKSSHFLKKLLEGLIREGPFESKSFALAVCGGLIPGDKDYRKIRRDFDEGVLLDDKICVLPVTNDPKLQNFDAKSGFIVLPEVAIVVDAFPANEIISAVFDEVLGQLARPLGYLAVHVFRLAGLSLADKNINWPKTLVPYEDYGQTFRQLRALHQLKLFELEIPKFIGIQFSTKFALISSEIIGNCEFNVISSEEIEVGIVPNNSSILNLSHWNGKLPSKQFSVDIQHLACPSTSGSFRFASSSSGYRLVILIGKIHDLRVEFTEGKLDEMRPPHFPAVQWNGTQGLLAISGITTELIQPGQGAVYSPLPSLSDIETFSIDGKQMLESILHESLAK